jgi:hypothetical protein
VLRRASESLAAGISAVPAVPFVPVAEVERLG